MDRDELLLTKILYRGENVNCHRTPTRPPANLTRFRLVLTRNPDLRRRQMASSICRRWRIGLLLLPPLLLFLPHLLSVSELHKKVALVERSPKPKSKPNHLVLGPAAGQGLPDRIQCKGSTALNKAFSTNSSQISKYGNKISFVTVFALYNNTAPTGLVHMDRVTVGNVSYDKIERSMAILHTFVDFIQVSMPESDVVILTDPASIFQLKRDNVILLPIKGDYSRERLMLQRIKSYIAFLEQKYEVHLERPDQNTHYIFTDSDIAVVDDIGHIFKDYSNFHLALTFRNNKEQPLNSGFIAVRGTADSILKAKMFLQGVLEIYISRYMKASRMLGDQLALFWVVNSNQAFDINKFRKPRAFTSEINGASVLFLPCALYNWTPPEGAGQFHGMPLDVKVVHFKGSRKRLMLESWNFFKSTYNLSDMLCLILMSGRTKYDF